MYRTYWMGTFEIDPIVLSALIEEINKRSGDADAPRRFSPFVVTSDGEEVECNGDVSGGDPQRLVDLGIILAANGHTMQGTIEYEGDDRDDFGRIEATPGKLTVFRGERTYVDPFPFYIPVRKESE